MKICFGIHYRTRWGEMLVVSGSLPELGQWAPDRAAVMAYTPGDRWVLELDVAATEAVAFRYRYGVRHEDSGRIQWEATDSREFSCDQWRCDHAQLRDTWRSASDVGRGLLSSAFTRVILRPGEPAHPGEAGPAKGHGVSPCVPLHRFQIHAPRVAAGEALCLIGSDPALGGWDDRKAVVMDGSHYPLWRVNVVLKNRKVPLQYKYAVIHPKKRKIRMWEDGADRGLEPLDGPEEPGLTVITDEAFRHPAGPWRGAGVAVPVFSLRTRNSLGVGEFLDLKPLVDWAKRVGLRMIQLLPVNDTVATHTWTDSYPYAAISVFALHPIYLNIQALGTLSASVTQKIINDQRDILNRRAAVDYEAVMAVKSRFYKLIYDEQQSRFLADPEFKAFFEEHKAWLRPYAAFSYLRDLYGTPDHSTWGANSRCTEALLERLTAPDAPHFHDIGVHYFIQFHLHRQLREAADYARANGIAFKGDIPIGVYRHSVDTWTTPGLFRLDSQAGAPPDAFATSGQNWRFPTYNWEAMARDGYAWWRARLRTLSAYFDVIRLDHILGFFRIWEIPWEHVEGIMGHFNPALPFTVDDLMRRRLVFDRERFAEPYIRHAMLPGLFGEYTAEVKRDFLEENRPGCFRLKAPFRTQRAVEERLASPPDADMATQIRNEKIKRGLWTLISEVLFLEVSGSHGQAYHPRHSFQQTQSFRDLDDGTKGVLESLYVDYFYRRHEAFWRDQAMVKLPALKKATSMLICGEDLGMVPECVAGVMAELGILSLAVQRMPRESGREFLHPADCPYLSVCTPSCHDMSTVRGWWEEDRERTQRFYNRILGHEGPAPEACTSELCREVVVQHLYSPALWAVFPIQDLLGMSGSLRRPNSREEQINDPSHSAHYWRYRMHVTLEDLLKQDEFNEELRGMLAKSGRNVEG